MFSIKKNRKGGNAFVGLIIIGAIIWGISSLFSNEENYEHESYSPSAYSSDYGAGAYSSYNDNDYEYEEGEEYPVGFEGTDTMEACNGNTGNCYDLEIDSDGENVERINFPNGGWRDVSYSDCEDGYCIVEDEDGTEWELEY